MVQSEIANILEYWKLCEISDFDRFTLKDMKLLSEFEPIKYRKEDNLNFLKSSKVLIHRVYYGLIKTELLIEHVYKYLKEKDKLINFDDSSLMKDLERIKTQEYTYLAYFFVNHALKPQSINSTTVVINPIFYILKYINEKEKLNNNAYKNYIADQSNAYGSYYKVNGKNEWVGMPLVVHRRCIEPMFSISNAISYNNKMVLMTPNLKADDKIHNLPASCWIDIKSSMSDFENSSNSSIKERKSFEIFFKKYKKYLEKNFYVISPFKSIYKIMEKEDYYENNEEDYIGTVHTFQGKEAEVVFFMLGGNVQRPGSKGWVSSKANILNVANTRAKKRFYIIGDYDLWKTHQYFNTVTKILNRKSISELVEIELHDNSFTI